MLKQTPKYGCHKPPLPTKHGNSTLKSNKPAKRNMYTNESWAAALYLSFPGRFEIHFPIRTQVSAKQFFE